MAADLPLPTTEYVPLLISHGACLCLPAKQLTVPIPLIDVRINDERTILWASIQTPFGSAKPLFGLIRYARQDRLTVGSAFFDAHDHQLCAIIDVRAFGFPDYTEQKLITKAREHAKRLVVDILHRELWDSHFAAGYLRCVESGQ